MTAEHGGERPAAAPPNWQDWQQWVEDVDWSDWRSWLRRIASTDWTGAPWSGTPWEQPPDAGHVSLTLRAFGEDEPGPQIARHLRETWPGFRRWWHGGGAPSAEGRPPAAGGRARPQGHPAQPLPPVARPTPQLRGGPVCPGPPAVG